MAMLQCYFRGKVIHGIQLVNIFIFLLAPGYRRVLFTEGKLPDLFFVAFQPVFLCVG